MSTILEQAVEHLAEAFVLADLGDADGLADLQRAVADLLSLDDLPDVPRQLVAGLGELLDQLTDESAADRAKAASTVETTIRELQSQLKQPQAIPEAEPEPEPLLADTDIAAGLAQFESLDAFDLPVQEERPELDIAATLADVRARLAVCAPQDLPELAQLHELMTALPEAPGCPAPVATASQAACDLLEGLILGDAADPAADLTACREQLDGCDDGAALVADAAVQPPHAAAQTPVAGETAAAGFSFALPPSVDKAMLTEFLASQPSVLEELEAILLATPLAPDAAAVVRRIVHTLKGETGILGMSAVSDLCHRAEEVLEHQEVGELVDPLLEMKDWLGKVFGYYQGVGEAPPSSETLRLLQPEEVPMEESQELPAFESTDNMFVTADESLLQDFIAESVEHLEASDAHLLQLESDPCNRDLLDAVFRGFHTIKGVAGFLGLSQIQTLAHEAENLLDNLRQGDLTVNPALLRVVFDSVDALKTMVKTGAFAAGPAALTDLIRRIRATKRGKQQRLSAAAATQAPQPAAQAANVPAKENAKIHLRDTLKVDAERLDQLIDTVGELVIAESMVSQSLATVSGLQEQKRHQNNLSKITRELQEICMSLRMVPVRPTFQKMARVVHDLAHKEGKKVRFITAGEDTELDKTVVDQVGDPLLHMVRNAVDHGIEGTPEERVAAGKPAEATIELRAFHQGGSIFIEIRDDGRGLDRDAIFDKAFAQGLITDEKELSERDLYMLIFEPGFSTRQQATDISGRGVGMDVVKRNIQGLRGRVDVQTEKGVGTTFTIKLPLTLAIIEGMLVRVGEERYAIPTVSIMRTVTLDDDRVFSALDRGQMLKLDEEVLPLFDLRDLFMIGADGGAASKLAIILENESERFAVKVDELLGQEQIVLKSLGSVMQGIPGLAGGAIMPDGQVGLIVDVAGLRRLTHNESSTALAATA